MTEINQDQNESIEPTMDPNTMLRRRAEEKTRVLEMKGQEARTPEEIQRLLHELHVHQIELELQNEELRRIQAALEASRARYFNLYDMAPIGYFTISEQGLILEANLTVATLLATTRKALDMQRLTRFILPEDQEIYYRHRKLLFETSATQACEIRLVRQNGTPFWARLEATLMQDPDNGALVCRAVMSDINERRRIEEIKEKTNEALKLALKSSKAGTWDWDIIHDSFHWSEEFLSIFGINTQTAVGFESWTKVILPDDRESVVKRIYDTIKEKKDLMNDFRITLPNQEIHWIRIIGKTFYEGDNPLRMIGLCMDITEQKRAEEERQKLEHRLQTQKLESLGVLAGGIAHDFNNLLSGIFGSIILARTESNKSQSNEYLSDAMAAMDRARALTRQLLTFAKGGVPNRKVGYLFPFIKDTAQFALSGANVSCSYDVPSDLWPCDFDRNQIAQVIDNIIINSQQAMPKGGTIVIYAANLVLKNNRTTSLPDGDYVRISIKDYGIGIPADILPYIFDPFFTTKQKGSGLGLSTCYSIISRHNGCIEVDSKPGKGSTFHIYLPACHNAVINQTEDLTHKHKGTGRILIMDDEQIIRRTTADILKVFGYSTETTKDGQEALDFFIKETEAKRSFSAIILDLTIPGGMGGKETVEAIRKIDTKIPIFVSSGYSEDPILANPEDYGFTDSIRKPFRISELSDILNRHLKNSTADIEQGSPIAK